MALDLGKKIERGGALPSPIDSKKKFSYPSLSLSDKVAEAFREEAEDLDIGDTFTATVKFKVVGKRDDEFGKNLSFDALSMDNIKGESTKEGGDDEEAEGVADKNQDDDETEKPGELEEDAAQEKALGYKRPKANSKKETPDISAQSLL